MQGGVPKITAFDNSGFPCTVSLAVEQGTTHMKATATATGCKGRDRDRGSTQNDRKSRHHKRRGRQQLHILTINVNSTGSPESQHIERLDHHQWRRRSGTHVVHTGGGVNVADIDSHRFAHADSNGNA
jgi:hypothetical protein